MCNSRITTRGGGGGYFSGNRPTSFVPSKVREISQNVLPFFSFFFPLFSFFFFRAQAVEEALRKDKDLQKFVIFEFFSLNVTQILMKFCRNFVDILENVEIFRNF